MVIEGGVNTQQPLARVISIHPDGAAYQNGQLKVGEIIKQVDGIELEGIIIWVNSYITTLKDVRNIIFFSNGLLITLIFFFI